jgi:hypothetical protein
MLIKKIKSFIFYEMLEEVFFLILYFQIKNKVQIFVQISCLHPLKEFCLVIF